MEEKFNTKNFEQSIAQVEPAFIALNLSNTTLQLGRVAMNFARIERIPRYEDGERESDAEHSFMLALTAPELARTLELPLDLGLVSQFATVHDLIELKTLDVPTLMLDDSALTQKELAEHNALQELLQELPPYTAHLLERYEHQSDPEARFVRLVDKLLPVVVDIIGEGRRVLEEDYSIHSRLALHNAYAAVHERHVRKFGDEFMELLAVHKELSAQLEQIIDFDA